MGVATFEDLCASICEVAGVESPLLLSDDHGVTSFTLELDGFPVSVMQQRDASEVAVLACRLGKVREEEEFDACRTLMESNFLAIADPAMPCVGRSPVSGDFVFHYSVRLRDASGVEAFQAITRMSKLAQEWRSLLQSPPEDAADTPAMGDFA